jgi:hypothetical protein
MSRRGAPLQRDTDASPFASILDDVLLRIPGAYAAALVDHDGECVDYAGRGDPFDIKVAAAHWRIVIGSITEQRTFAGVRTIVARARQKPFLAHVLPDDYALVVLLGRRAGFAPMSRAVAVVERALAEEAGWPIAKEGPRWTPVDVDLDARRRPYRLRPSRAHRAKDAAPAEHSLEVLGAVMGLRAGERGFRVRLDSGAEVTLVREPSGCWYADAAL